MTNGHYCFSRRTTLNLAIGPLPRIPISAESDLSRTAVQLSHQHDESQKQDHRTEHPER